MQAEYRKEWMETYLWVKKETEGEQEYVEKMLQYNPGEGRLPFLKQQEQGQEYYCYKVTGRKALNGIYAAMSIGEHQIRNILRQIFKILENGKEYLLEETDFVLHPNYIFAVLPQMKMELCYVPGYGMALKEQLEGLFEYFLNRVDYEDRKAVELLYDCYMFCVREEGGLSEIIKRIEGDEEDAEKKPGYQEKIRTAAETGLLKEPNARKEPVRKKESVGQERKTEENGAKEMKDTGSSGSYISWLAEKLFPRKKAQAVFLAEAGESYAVQEKESEIRQEPTVLLACSDKWEKAQLINEKTGEVILMEKFPFYIGSEKVYADFVLKEEGVSRIHCCIAKKEEAYLLSDLNSTNGTYLDGQEVVPGTEKTLWNEAVIKVAQNEFSVKLPCHS